MKDTRVRKLIDALERRFPGTKAISGPAPDDPHSGETWIELLNAPMVPPMQVDRFARKMEKELWGDEWSMVLVDAVSPEDTAKYYAYRLLKPRVAPPRRRRAAVPAAKRHRPAKTSA